MSIYLHALNRMLSKLVAFASSRRALQTVRALRLNCVAQRCYSCSLPSVPHHASAGIRQPVWLRKDVSSSSSSFHNQKRLYCAARQSEVSYEELQALMRSKDIKLIDVREPQELKEFGRIEGSVNIPLSKLKESFQMSGESFTERYKCDKPLLHDTNIVFYGLGPIKSTAALELAFKLGFKNVCPYECFILLTTTVGELHDALNLPPDQFEKKYCCAKPEEDDRLVFHCMLGRRSQSALTLALKLGYSKARHYKGGWVEFAKKSGLPENNCDS